MHSIWMVAVNFILPYKQDDRMGKEWLYQTCQCISCVNPCVLGLLPLTPILNILGTLGADIVLPSNNTWHNITPKTLQWH